jgi:outer membrane protein
MPKMNVNQKIRIALLPIALMGSALVAQSPSSSIPNAPAVQSPLVASAQSAPTGVSPVAGPTEGTATLLTRQDAEKIALANNPRIHVSQLIAKVQHQAMRERRADELPNLN